jgi:hypothetical protein
MAGCSWTGILERIAAMTAIWEILLFYSISNFSIHPFIFDDKLLIIIKLYDE